MKKPEEYLEQLYITDDGEPNSVHDSTENVADVIRQAQIDAINKTSTVCAQLAIISDTDCLHVADKLKKELE